jgi:ADP-ribosyl-[dinitrogen reductase] hydrolase
MNANTTDKVKACFLGLAVGDALGVPVEFSERPDLMSNPVRHMQGYGTWDQPPGTWSDDSSLSFCLAESLTTGYDPVDIGTKFVRWYTDGYWGAHHKFFDIGLTTRVALTRIMSGKDPVRAGETREQSNGNGSLMRIAPAALYFAHETDDLLYERLKEISSITHGHFRSVLSCFIFSKILIALFQGQDKNNAYQNMVSAVNDFAARHQFDGEDLKPFQWILSGKIDTMTTDQVSSTGYVLHTLEASLWCLLTTSTYSQAVLKAVNLGGDTDTTACVTGALAGVYYGRGEIPQTWIETLARKDDVIDLAERFAEHIKLA